MKHLVADHILQLKPYSPGKPIEEVEREYGISECVKLASNENPLGPSPKALEAIAQALPQLHLYPDGSGFYLRRALAERMGLDPAMFFFGNGSNEIIELLIRTFLSHPGTNAVTSECTFVVYRLIMQGAGRDFRASKMTPDHRYDLPAMLELVDENTRLVFIANPNNPTGTYVTEKELSDFCGELDRRFGEEGPIVVLDEAYKEYVSAEDYPEGVDWLERRPRTILLRTFSKAYGLAGIRIGYGMASPDIWELVNRLRQPFNINNLSLVAAMAALEDTGHLEKSVALNREGMALLTRELTARGLGVTPSQTNFLLVDFHRDASELYIDLLRRGVIVRPMTPYGLSHCARVTIGLPDENTRLLAALDEVL
jgi:histidinol-phosphate aminotransferase